MTEDPAFLRTVDDALDELWDRRFDEPTEVLRRVDLVLERIGDRKLRWRARMLAAGAAMAQGEPSAARASLVLAKCEILGLRDRLWVGPAWTRCDELLSAVALEAGELTRADGLAHRAALARQRLWLAEAPALEGQQLQAMATRVGRAMARYVVIGSAAGRVHLTACSQAMSLLPETDELWEVCRGLLVYGGLSELESARDPIDEARNVLAPIWREKAEDGPWIDRLFRWQPLNSGG